MQCSAVTREWTSTSERAAAGRETLSLAIANFLAGHYFWIGPPQGPPLDVKGWPVPSLPACISAHSAAGPQLQPGGSSPKKEASGGQSHRSHCSNWAPLRRVPAGTNLTRTELLELYHSSKTRALLDLRETAEGLKSRIRKI